MLQAAVRQCRKGAHTAERCKQGGAALRRRDVERGRECVGNHGARGEDRYGEIAVRARSSKRIEEMMKPAGRLEFRPVPT